MSYLSPETKNVSKRSYNSHFSFFIDGPKFSWSQQ